MRKPSWAVIAALAVPVLCAAPAEAAVPHAGLRPGDVTATGCVRGGAVTAASAGREEAGSFTAGCQGGTHDGESVT
ncbi:hypothetical protein [Streptomyces sp. MH13]|uniref:hypothetical protein n=1 Tax=unclassified Streptomyces TaxID=2593676 RepID=UPI003CE8E133